MKLEKILKKLIINEPFWGLFLMGLNKTYSDEIDTLAVVKKGIQVELIINKTFFESLPELEQMAVLIHELHHISYGHMFLINDFDDKYKFNIAADIEVNCYIENLPKDAIFAKDYNFPEKLGTKWYYNNLNDINNLKTLDNHEPWKDFSNITESQKELIKSQIEHQLEQTAEQVLKNRGTIPNSIKEIIDNINKKKQPVYNWKLHFRKMLGSKIDTDFKKTYKKESKRFFDFPGIKLKRKIKILVAVDTSGSISNDNLKEFFAEIHHIHKVGADVDIIEFDAKIQSKWEYNNNKEIKILGRGGTDFKPPIDYYRKNKKEYTLCVIFTDGFAPIENLNVSNNLIWVITQNGKFQKYPGNKTIYISNNK